MIIYKDFEFDMSHRLDNYNGLCKNIHGHTYKLSVGIVVNKLGPLGMGVDFKIIKEVVNQSALHFVDHTLWLKNSKENAALIKVVKKQKMKLILTDYNPTAENMALIFWKMLSKCLPLFTLTLYETPTSKVVINENNYAHMKKLVSDIEFSGDCE
jgi:6-pyruvoyltetrahydropterin/6-carboxytetrahydropterin synthase